MLPDGSVWAWQAKYLFGFGDSEIGQIHHSVVRVLEMEPDLKRFYIALPYDLPAGDVVKSATKRKSAFTKWTEKKAEWQAMATDRGMNVEFIYVGAHEFVSELTKPEHAGRLRYWFEASVLSSENLNRRLSDVVLKVGRRYTPALHVEVGAVQALEALGRTDHYVRRVRVALAGLREARTGAWHPPRGDEEAFASSIEACRNALVEAETALQRFLEAVTSAGPLPDIIDTVRAVEPAAEEVHRLLQDRHLREGRYYHDQAASLYHTYTKVRHACWASLSLLRSADTQTARDGRVLMTGRAGVGKTHLFCDVASRRVSSGHPTVVVLGQDFVAGKPLLSQIGDLAQIDGTLDEVLSVFDAAGEAAGCFTMLMIDAINEGAEAERWVDDLRVLAGSVDRYPHVVLAVSCRTEFVESVVGNAEGFPRVEHQGFSEAMSEAVDRYTEEYNLERLTFPVLNPEYGNPLFLKLACEALSTLGHTRFALGSAGLTTVCGAFLEAVNKRLAAPTRCDYDLATNLVQAAVRQLAEAGPGPYPRSVAAAITEQLLPGTTWSKSLFLGLLREGVLMDTYKGQVAFSYQRLGDVYRAVLLAEKTPSDLTAWYQGLGNAAWAERGTLGALAVVAPETLGEEVIDLFKEPETGEIKHEVIDAFLESIVLRSPLHVTDRTVRIVEQLVDFEDWTRPVWERLVQVACVPDHNLNADWTHRLLKARDLTTRDLSWSEWLIGSTDSNGYEDEDAVSVLLDWGWPKDADAEPGHLPDDVSRLATLILAWMLTTPDRRVRNRATKALVSVGERGTGGFAQGLAEFAGCDDPYVTERLAAAACAVTLRAADPATIVVVANATAAMVSASWPENLLTRDYLRRISASAQAHGWDGPVWLPPYGTDWPPTAKSYDEIEVMDSAPEYRYASIWGSVHGQLGDFGRYVIEPAIDHFDVPDKKALRHLVERIVFTRVLDLGWTPEKFDGIERRRHVRHDGPVERFGKKYQWIAFYEVLGRLADNFQLKERWSISGDPFPFEYAEQLVYRDVDPTVLIHGGRSGPMEGEPPWFAPVTATFPDEVPNEYPEDLDGVPDPLDLIHVVSPTGTQWLSLIRHESWKQAHPPEITALKAPNLNVWMQVRGYLVPTADVPALLDWLKGTDGEGQDWDGRWMAENADVHSRLLGALPGSPDWDWADGNAEPRSIGDRAIPADLYQPIAWYGGTGADRDDAGTDEPTGFVPSRMLFDLLQLRAGRDFCWTDDIGLAVQDPSAGMNESSTLLMRRDLSDRLAEAGYSLFWTVLLNKERHDHSYGRPSEDYRWVSASASYVLEGPAVELVASNAWHCRPGEGRTKTITWGLKTSE
ncbi:hypothetical protein BF93_10880 [Brachybacterium phenoliresistens]|uniref:ATP-binding protein n=1 Tax=Brachybacterium phenoliresistens TaxID=396014 RepID=Z9JXB9_9MICO|nr:hypothetical protein [Brachybacterium phenoliresistens]EWS82446.1 hypothetical protein BF93_10880 [Brachybacterium phenoliresistens]